MEIMQAYHAQILRYEAFWNRENTDRCVLNFTAPKANATPFRKPKNLEEKWMDEGKPKIVHVQGA